jgi:hypothetical protein
MLAIICSLFKLPCRHQCSTCRSNATCGESLPLGSPTHQLPLHLPSPEAKCPSCFGRPRENHAGERLSPPALIRDPCPLGAGVPGAKETLAAADCKQGELRLRDEASRLLHAIHLLDHVLILSLFTSSLPRNNFSTPSTCVCATWTTCGVIFSHMLSRSRSSLEHK